jgi:hypothetical protein
MVADAEKTMQSDLLQQDINADDFIKMKMQSTRGGPRRKSILRALGTFTLPVSAIVLKVLLVHTVLLSLTSGRKQLIF